DSRHLVYQGLVTDGTKRGLYVESIDGGTPPQFLVAAESMPAYVPGLLLYHREGTLLAQPFDPDHLRLTGEPARIADNIAFNVQNGRATFGASQTGVLAYCTGGASESLAELAWIDRAGRPTGTVGDAQPYYQIRLSPDQRRIAFAV